jgi:DNA-binding response OmpR family regulator
VPPREAGLRFGVGERVGWLFDILPIPSARVLVVKDDPSTQRALIMRLTSHDIQTAGARSAGKAIRMTGSPGLTHVILDLNLSDGEGTAVLRHIRESSQSLKVVLLGAVREGPALEEALRLAPDARCTKPVDTLQLLAWLGAA